MAIRNMKVLIVDDELIVRQGLRATVDWGRYGMEVVADAPNGLKGWEAFLQYKPDVVITDIVMPKLNGLELARRVKQAASETQILLLSCHEDFSYAQQGFRIGASGYVLKTALDEEELGYYLRQFEQQFRQRSQEQGESLNEARDRQAQIYSWLGGFTSDIEEHLARWFQTDWAWMQGGCRMYLIRSDSEQTLNPADWVGMEQAVGLPNERIPCGKGRDLFLCKPEADELVMFRLKAAKSQNKKLTWQADGPIHTHEAWILIVMQLYRQDELWRKYDVWNDAWPEPITQAVQLILKDEGSSMSVAELADAVGFSRSHFSTLFKRVVGENIIDFQSKMKLHKAEYMLLTTLMSVSEISEHLGMIDANYFSKWFKRVTGLSPSQYRSSKKNVINELT
ncbi:response regulator transcription factor [Paenibacillus guangzhouensis]|uniref:response regulator transcription factor n=1 Tax=Paenibacillus guangzhouensis TaxID=1473112 RepID=UPI001266DE64|nr:helix-turn-helix domain-containing protein [Paenibacillus guangzhouensis]